MRNSFSQDNNEMTSKRKMPTLPGLNEWLQNANEYGKDSNIADELNGRAWFSIFRRDAHLSLSRKSEVQKEHSVLFLKFLRVSH